MCSGRGEALATALQTGLVTGAGTKRDPYVLVETEDTEYTPDAEHAATPGPLHSALIEAYRRGYEDRAHERDYDPGAAL